MKVVLFRRHLARVEFRRPLRVLEGVLFRRPAVVALAVVAVLVGSALVDLVLLVPAVLRAAQVVPAAVVPVEAVLVVLVPEVLRAHPAVALVAPAVLGAVVPAAVVPAVAVVLVVVEAPAVVEARVNARGRRSGVVHWRSSVLRRQPASLRPMLLCPRATLSSLVESPFKNLRRS